MDKLLLSTLFGLLAGFLTAAISFVKLVNDKEGRVTDYRQKWTETVRASLAQLVAQIQALTDLFKDRARYVTNCERFSKDVRNAQTDEEKDTFKTLLDHNKSLLTNVNYEIIQTRNEVYASFNTARLHFKPHDPHFVEVENKFDIIIGVIRAMHDFRDDESKTETAANQVLTHCNEVIAASRGILKGTWETIKQGEPSYHSSKQFAKWGSAAFLAIFVVFAAHALISFYRSPENNINSAQAAIPEAERGASPVSFPVMNGMTSAETSALNGGRISIYCNIPVDSGEGAKQIPKHEVQLK